MSALSINHITSHHMRESLAPLGAPNTYFPGQLFLILSTYIQGP